MTNSQAVHIHTHMKEREGRGGMGILVGKDGKRRADLGEWWKSRAVESGNLHSWNVLSRECIGCVADQKAGLTHSSAENKKTVTGCEAR